ncbi:hypothetical protein CHELA20_51889 [Hyphomicrobiales bacterium]|nr:hypothetical protein CHELA20_51889 [Hyphomicrobiales bacterium]
MLLTQGSGSGTVTHAVVRAFPHLYLTSDAPLIFPTLVPFAGCPGEPLHRGLLQWPPYLSVA